MILIIDYIKLLKHFMVWKINSVFTSIDLEGTGINAINNQHQIHI